ncbi:MAG TPA: ATP-binding protein [Chloroflexia bacterium]|nr:ATP-binding protein [Chloroflexia bacterium]
MSSDNMRRKPEKFLGVVTAGSLSKGLQARIRTLTPLEKIQTGQFVALEGDGIRFFGLLTDVTLGATSDSVLLDPPYPEDGASSLLNEVLHGVYTYGEAHIQPSLSLQEGDEGPKPVRSVPGHFAPVFIAEERDFEQVFGAENINEQGGKVFAVGKPLDMEIDVCLDLDKFVERSNGIFGKSGTGKSVLTRLILSGLIRANTCSNLVFDMHNEYGGTTKGEYARQQIKGLRDLFGGSRVMVYAVRDRRPGDRGRGEPRATQVDGDIVIGMNHIDVDDILLLRNELQLNATAAESAYILQGEFKDTWMSKLLNMDGEEIKEFCERTGANRNSIDALKRKLGAIQRLPFVEEHFKNLRVVDEMVAALASGRHVVVQFGGSDDMLSYMLVANIITRTIHRKYRELTEIYRRTQRAEDEPRRVMITIEEAHKFLTPEVAGQTIFGTIAREMRKYYVTLLVVDQRPSSIDNEVLSQIGTRIVALINDERDIDAVFTGVSGSAGLKTVLASLDSRQQALLLGHASPMPVVIRTRPFDEEFYKAIQVGMPAPPPAIRAIPNRNNNGNGNPASDGDMPFDEWAEKEEESWNKRVEKDKADLFG